MDNIRDIIPQVIKGFVDKKQQEQALLSAAWEQVIDKKVLPHTVIESFTDGKCDVCVDNSAFLFHCNSQKSKILKQLQSLIPGVKTLNFKIGKVR